MSAQESPENFIPIKEFTAAKQAGLFSTLQQSQISGQLIMTSPQADSWTFYLQQGQIVYATGGIHPVRRWRRNIAIHLPQINIDFLELQKELTSLAKKSFKICWEYDILYPWIGQQKITKEQANQMLLSSLVEILFDITQAIEITCEIVPDRFLSTKLPLINPQQVINKTENIWQAWQNAQIADRSPDLAPVIRYAEQLQQKTSPKIYQTLEYLLDGEKTIRDVAVAMKRDPLQITRSLLPYIQSGLIGLINIPDLASPLPNNIEEEEIRPLIACVDDSPVIGHMMEKVLGPAGYRFISVEDPLRAIGSILELKPDLIFLDVVMPNVNGYELCAQLRKLSHFRKTPIIFLTGRNGLIDRVKANLVGASDYLSKESDAWLLLRTIKKHLKQRLP